MVADPAITAIPPQQTFHPKSSVGALRANRTSARLAAHPDPARKPNDSHQNQGAEKSGKFRRRSPVHNATQPRFLRFVASEAGSSPATVGAASNGLVEFIQPRAAAG